MQQPSAAGHLAVKELWSPVLLDRKGSDTKDCVLKASKRSIFTFEPSTAFVIICHNLANEELRERGVRRYGIQHSTEFLNDGHELDSTLKYHLVRKVLQNNVLSKYHLP